MSSFTGKVRLRYWRWRRRRYVVSEARTEALFSIETGIDPHIQLASQADPARPWELGALAMMRQGDEAQIRAMELVLLAKTVWWTRAAVVVAMLASVVALVIAIID